MEIGHDDSLQSGIVPHARTLRKAREQVKQMVIDGFSTRRIKRYLARWCAWWVTTAQCWTKEALWAVVFGGLLGYEGYMHGLRSNDDRIYQQGPEVFSEAACNL